MEIEAHQTKHLTVEINDSTAKQITSELIRKACGLPEGCAIESGKLVKHSIESWSSYSSPITKTIRDATELDIAACLVLDEITKR